MALAKMQEQCVSINVEELIEQENIQKDEKLTELGSVH